MSSADMPKLAKTSSASPPIAHTRVLNFGRRFGERGCHAVTFESFFPSWPSVREAVVELLGKL